MLFPVIWKFQNAPISIKFCSEMAFNITNEDVISKQKCIAHSKNNLEKPVKIC